MFSVFCPSVLGVKGSLPHDALGMHPMMYYDRTLVSPPPNSTRPGKTGQEAVGSNGQGNGGGVPHTGRLSCFVRHLYAHLLQN